MSVILYSTEGCHLCEQAHKLLLTVGVEPQIVDIAFDDELFSRYGVTIPVVHIENSELNWPFNLQQLQQWLENNGITYHS
ncbi:NrdH-redoxin [Vibrio breoganii]|uniref:Glutaredoxin family protein n=1 Tax=Vibrio breoganii TaxID=553239 RepID=A0AAN0XUL8_9VIBR|nr:glutaredoxin family protein [Vibrio breoganii]ANO32891.1 NrdH-redoxin [Vibrio breoganii]MDN3715641.1 glutaredoxin family protein [Vibrio breoganii]NMO74163.1 glutaredoxin family protein [Vibrio breoganii]NMR70908.1 glutaredoxin family protein [Vibrio breoganii]OCH76547.1 NrdH-redoxin [Vibrio breoganii]